MNGLKAPLIIFEGAFACVYKVSNGTNSELDVYFYLHNLNKYYNRIGSVLVVYIIPVVSNI